MISSGGKTNGFRTYDLYTDEAEGLKLSLYDSKWNTNIWLSMRRVAMSSQKLGYLSAQLASLVVSCLNGTVAIALAGCDVHYS